MKKKVLNTILLLSLLPVFSVHLFSQDVISPDLQLKYIKNTNDQRILQTSLTYSQNRMVLPIPGMEISFFTDGDQRDLIATAVTDIEGIAKLELSGDMKLLVDMDGMWAFSSEYNGNDTIDAASSEISVKDVKLEMELSEIDSIKTLTVHAFINENGSDVPVPDEMVMVYVPRMFSFLTIGELYLDETGTATVEFPGDIPGDKDGNLTIIAMFEDNYTFGTVEKEENLNWGVPSDYSVPISHRALWTKSAPKWMIYTLSILLTGVWGHYLFAFISLLRIKRGASLQETPEEYRY